ncbi:MAG: hypothetical protein RBT03_11175 [Kiritimatiellia bacterium]|jgi:hypothetical protein|nr:hypothetical protein [Kiritimatiellia bacterium]
MADKMKGRAWASPAGGQQFSIAWKTPALACFHGFPVFLIHRIPVGAPAGRAQSGEKKAREEATDFADETPLQIEYWILDIEN